MGWNESFMKKENKTAKSLTWLHRVYNDFSIPLYFIYQNLSQDPLKACDLQFQKLSSSVVDSSDLIC